MIALTLVMCLNTQPANCRNEDVAFDGSIMQCAMFGQAVAANYMTRRPKWSLKRYRCSPIGLKDA